MTYDPTQLDDLEMLTLLAKGLICYLGRLRIGEKDPFPYPDSLLRGFNQLRIACILQGVDRAKHPCSIPEFVEIWGRLPLLAWPLKLEISAYTFSNGDYLIEPGLDHRPTQLCKELAELLGKSVSQIS
ncbi:pPIWI_RE_Y domain-containing protein [Lyngbya aestuarii]|uniref:pPIWI_RE_Y domain-containing protein n=1 Tax=Lyngbya aestuarii TaxID=118322 RepID=UPI00403D710A